MDESLFYIAGGALVAVTLILSLVGMRSGRFPSGNVLAAGLVVVFLLVAATAVGAVELAQHEQGEKLEEANTAADVTEAEDTAAGQDAGAAPEPTPGGGSGEGASADEGGKVFVAAGCGSCHTVASLGSDAQGTIGPNLDTVLAGQDDAFIEESIVDPDAVVAEGFPGGTMPATYGSELSPKEIDALVAFLSQSAGS
ncbi:MAG: cytochrome c [Acidobacteria bacterium]|nr:MAG: cytochrome c [Acidobacteriota bacterium]GIK78077.1 MAG: hypothetical protein BroJett022_17670 [Actinomycetes bacterium]